MGSLVLELQKEAMDDKVQVSALLRKAKVVAAKLQRTDIDEWLQKETQGYMENDSTPAYRKLPAEIQALDPATQVWMPVDFSNAEFGRKISFLNVGIGVSEIEALLDETIGNASISLGREIPRSLLEKIGNNSALLQRGIKPTWRISRQQIPPILDAVRNKILDWSLELEAQGIKGDDMMFSKEEVGKAATVIFNINNSTVGDINGLTSSNMVIDDHSITSNINISDYSQIYSELKNRGVPDDAVKELKEAIDLLQKGNAKGKESALKIGAKFIKNFGAQIGSIAIVIKGILIRLSS